jgi:hypothetical protein
MLPDELEVPLLPESGPLEPPVPELLEPLPFVPLLAPERLLPFFDARPIGTQSCPALVLRFMFGGQSPDALAPLAPLLPLPMPVPALPDLVPLELLPDDCANASPPAAMRAMKRVEVTLRMMFSNQSLSAD